MKRIFSWKIDLATETMSIEQFLRTHGCSHHVLTHLKRTECGILLNGIWAYTNQKLKAGDQMEWARRMNSIRSRAMKIVNAELIFAAIM